MLQECQVSGSVIPLCRGEGFLLLKKVGWILVKESGSSGIAFTFFSPNFDSPCSLPLSSLVGCWKMETLVPWKEVVTVVAVGLRSMLFIAAVVNNPIRRTVLAHPVDSGTVI